MEGNPFVLAENLRQTLKRFITTALPVSHRYPRLREHYHSAIEGNDLVVGPYVEGLSDFVKGEPLFDLLSSNEGFLHDGLSNLPEEIQLRPLHEHQQRALERSAQDGRNLIVATGTGSGKTECFLYPIAHKLLSDPELDKPGVRVLIVYPMNALANDQLYYRLAPLFGVALREHGVTFGRFTGQLADSATRATESAALLQNTKLMEALGVEEIPSNWLLTRDEMRETPPHVLITNYAMLEHLLLLPKNAPLFTQSMLNTIVLDEVHTYSGAQATEVAFLLRKLKNRLGLQEPVQVFATSASLPSGGQAAEQVAHFASDLFGEEVLAEDLVTGTREQHAFLVKNEHPEFSLDAETWLRVGEIFQSHLAVNEFDEDDVLEFLTSTGLDDQLDAIQEGDDGPSALARIFAANREIRVVAAALDRGVEHFDTLANSVFREVGDLDQRTAALTAVIQIGMVAKQNKYGFPLLPARYHLSVSTIEGFCLKPADTSVQREGWSGLRSGRSHEDEQESLYFPLFGCRRCGQPYLEAFGNGTHISNRPHPKLGARYRRIFLVGLPPETRVDDEEDDERVLEQQAWHPVEVLCSRNENARPISLYEVTTAQDDDQSTKLLKKCPCCGTRSFTGKNEVITRFHPGNEAMGGVVTQQVLSFLPSPLQFEGETLPMRGRSLLAFSDNRETAAYFAPYFEGRSRDLAIRAGMLSTLQSDRDLVDDCGGSFYSIADAMLSQWTEQRIAIPLRDENGELVSDRGARRRTIIGLVAREFCTPTGRRNSLEALGLVKVRLCDAVRNQVLEILADKPTSAEIPVEDRSILLDFFVETIRRERAIENLWGVDLTSDDLWDVYRHKAAFQVETTNSNRYHGFLPSLRSGGRSYFKNRRTHYLISQLQWSQERSLGYLREVWSAMIQAEALVRIQDGFGIDAQALWVEPSVLELLHCCQGCGLRQHFVVGEKCTAYNCDSSTLALGPPEADYFRTHNHYFNLMTEMKELAAVAAEHTANLSTELREGIERDFAKKKINILSCTTTLEVGVDLGDLEAVVNLNVPPGIANYQQRTGRAGRRAQAAPVCVTVARDSLFDQDVFKNFGAYLGKPVQVPFVSLENPFLFRRHQVAVLLSHYLLDQIPEDKVVNAPSLDDLLPNPFGEEQSVQKVNELRAWLESEAGVKAREEAEHLAQRVEQGIGLVGQPLSDEFVARLGLFYREMAERLAQYEDKKREAFTEYGQTGAQEEKILKRMTYWAGKVKQFRRQYLTNLFSSRGLIPTYSFPVHQLTLEVLTEEGRHYRPGAGDISLSRDALLGLSSYAPGSEVTARGRSYQSAGIARYPRQFQNQGVYSVCKVCNHVDLALELEDLNELCTNCHEPRSGPRRKHLEPRGFVTELAKRAGKKISSSPSRPKSADEARLITVPADEQFEESGMPRVLIGKLKALPLDEDSAPGRMFVVNKGPKGKGFKYCAWCGHAHPDDSQNDDQTHNEPLTGKRCNNENLRRIDLSHEFQTDIAILRLQQPFYPQANDEEERANALTAFHVTLGEAMRLACAELLNVLPQEVRVTTMPREFGLDVVLYDAVAGGAGYSMRVGREISVQQILQRALAKLGCPNNCASSCNSCLNDYANQRHWDVFDRTLIMGWLTAFLNDDLVDEYVEVGLNPWHQASTSALFENLRKAGEIAIVAPRLFSGDGEGTDIRSWLERLLIEKQVRLYLPTRGALLNHLGSLEARSWVRAFTHRLDSGGLQVLEAPQLFELGDKIPRFIGISGGHVHGWFVSDGQTPIMSKLLPGMVYQGGVSDEFMGCFEGTNWTDISSAVLDKFSPVQVVHLKPGQQADLDDIFSPLNGVYIEQLRLEDPFCPYHMDSLLMLLRNIVDLAGEINAIRVIGRELHRNDDKYERPADAKKALQMLLRSLGVDTSVTIKSFHARKEIHDRSLEAVVINEEGAEQVWRFDMSGGVDKLLDRQSDTKVYRYQQRR